MYLTQPPRQWPARRAHVCYKGADKATLGELNKQHEIVKLLTTSLTKVRASSRNLSLTELYRVAHLLADNFC